MAIKKTTGSKSTGGKSTATVARKDPATKPATTPGAVAVASAPAPNTGAPEAQAGAPVDDAASAEQNFLTKKALFERVKAQSAGVKGSDVRTVMDAVLDVLGAAIVEGDGIKIQPFGTLKVQRRKPMPGGDVVICKLRRSKPEPKGKDPLAEAAE